MRPEVTRAATEAVAGREMLSSREFIPLIALLMSLVALSIDAMLPALPVIGSDLGAAQRNDAQLVVTSCFWGWDSASFSTVRSPTPSGASPPSAPDS